MENAQRKIFSEILRQERKRRGWSQAYLAEQLKTEPKTVSRWERGLNAPNSYACREMCILFDMTLEELGLFSEEFAEPSQGSPNFQQTVFLAYSQADSTVVNRLKRDFQDLGINTSSDPLEKKPNVREDGLRKRIRDVLAVILIASPNSSNARLVKEALQIAEMYKRPVLVLWIAGNEPSEAVLLNLNGGRIIDARNGLDEEALAELVHALDLLSIFSQGTNRFDVLEPAFEPRNPYKGLRAFRGQDARDFFGRDALIDELSGELATILAQEKNTSGVARLLAVVGPSGSGKSSVVMAGLLPHLYAGQLVGSGDWVYLEPIVPGRYPIEALALTLEECLRDRSHKTIREDLEDDNTRGLHLIASHLARKPSTRVVLVVDQFEELFTLTASEQERRQFIDLLVTATTEPGGSVLGIITLRADFYDRPMYYPELGQIIKQQNKSVFPMSVSELQAVIERPAALPDVQMTFEEGLIGDLLFEVQGQIGALPLLQFTLDQLFQLRSGHRLTKQAYSEIGGMKGALSQHAQQTYAALPSDDHRRLARALFLRLIFPGATEQDTSRRRATRSELTLEDATETRVLLETTDAFVAARLLTTNQIADKTTIEVSHEALIREWLPLSGWLREAREDIALQQTLSSDTAEWLRRDKPSDRLYRGDQLDEALVWKAHSLPSRDEDAFLQASIAERERQQAAILELRQRERRYKRRPVLVGIGVSLIGLGAVALSIQLRPKSIITKSTIVSPPLSLPYSLRGHSKAVFSVAWSPDGKRLASAGADDTVRVWDAGTGKTQLTYRGHSASVNSVSWSPDGKWLASASTDATIHIWNVETGVSQLTYRGHSASVNSVSWSPDGKRLASASDDGTAQVWDMETGTTLFTYKGHLAYLGLRSPVTNVAWSPDGKWLASGSYDDTAQVWDAVTGKTQLTYRGHMGIEGVYCVAWSPDGKWLASASYDDTAQVWDAKTGAPQLTYKGHIGPVNSVSWSPDGKRLASAGVDTTVQVWDTIITTGTTQLTYRGHSEAVFSVAWSPDDNYLPPYLASAGNDFTAQAWSSTTAMTIFTSKGQNGTVTSVSWSPDGNHLASASTDATIHIWNVETGVSQLTYRGHSASVNGVAWSPNGTYLASAGDDSVRVWGAVTGMTLFTHKHTGTVTSVAWSPDGKRLVSAGADGSVRVWDAGTGASQLTCNGHTGTVTSVAWSPDGKRLASAGADGSVRAWDAGTGASQLIYRGHTDSVLSVAWSPDGKHLASAGDDHIVQIWDAVTEKTLFTYRGHTDSVLSIAWSPNGKRLASTGKDTTVRLWLWLQ